MMRTFTNIITFIFVGFLLLALVGIFQNIFQDIQKTFSHNDTTHVLAYRKE